MRKEISRKSFVSRVVTKVFKKKLQKNSNHGLRLKLKLRRNSNLTVLMTGSTDFYIIHQPIS